MYYLLAHFAFSPIRELFIKDVGQWIYETCAMETTRISLNFEAMYFGFHFHNKAIYNFHTGLNDK